MDSYKKRLFDIFLSLFILALLMPSFLILYFILILKIGKPIIFKQKRIGKNKKPFTIYKIRTMKIGSEAKQNKLRKLSVAPYPMFKAINDPRFIPFGKSLSKFGLDELPQLINILKGEMSFVGPRPLPVKEAKKLSSLWNFRYKVRPGIISKWALSPNRYKSLNSWKKLEKVEVENLLSKNNSEFNWSVKKDLVLIFDAFYKIIIKQFLKIKN